MTPGRIYEIVPDARLRALEWKVRAWRTAAFSALLLLAPIAIWLGGKPC